jgi:hypothetical protein
MSRSYIFSHQAPSWRVAKKKSQSDFLGNTLQPLAAIREPWQYKCTVKHYSQVRYIALSSFPPAILIGLYICLEYSVSKLLRTNISAFNILNLLRYNSDLAREMVCYQKSPL